MRFNGSLYGVSKKDLMLKAEELRLNSTMTDGEADVPGTDGSQGLQGETGLNGADGEPGRQGETGLNGADGEPGRQGETGLTGAQGLQGEPGRQGETGLTGEPGRQGETGMTGAQGEAAPTVRGFTGEVVVSDGRNQSVLQFENGILTGVE
tara:strand:+ start:74 stop:526 length:453 start_codon:yes stop_codon:yes gene_type:complete